MTKRTKPNFTAGQLRDQYDYDAETGKIMRRVQMGRYKPGTEIGHSATHGYIQALVYGRLYMVHRLAWYHTTGEWPPEEIDHINGVKSDNRLCNLRLATRHENTRNKGFSRNNTSGFIGVTWRKDFKKWQSQIGYNREHFHLGFFDDPKDAAKAYDAAAVKYFGEFANTNFSVRADSVDR